MSSDLSQGHFIEKGPVLLTHSHKVGRVDIGRVTGEAKNVWIQRVDLLPNRSRVLFLHTRKQDRIDLGLTGSIDCFEMEIFANRKSQDLSLCSQFVDAVLIACRIFQPANVKFRDEVIGHKTDRISLGNHYSALRKHRKLKFFLNLTRTV